MSTVDHDILTDIAYCDGRIVYHQEMESKCFQEGDPEGSTFHHAARRLWEHHRTHLRVTLAAHAFVVSDP
jgi:hypothetical protein